MGPLRVCHPWASLVIVEQRTRGGGECSSGIWRKNIPAEGRARAKALRPDSSLAKNSQGPAFASEVQRQVWGQVQGLEWLLKGGVLCSGSGRQGGHPW